MANPSTAHEPSMEEILASIRQIISEDGEPAQPSRAEASPPADPEPVPQAETVATAPEPAAAPPEDAPVKGEPMKPQMSESAAKVQPPAPAAESPRRPEPLPAAAPARQAAAAPAPAKQVPAPAPAPRTTWRAEERSLLSPDSDAAVSGAFSALAHTILAQNARTLEDLVVEMLGPMLHEWLDENLPSLVERLVKEEIERVSRGRR